MKAFRFCSNPLGASVQSESMIRSVSAADMWVITEIYHNNGVTWLQKE
jgi:hypothetical protein